MKNYLTSKVKKVNSFFSSSVGKFSVAFAFAFVLLNISQTFAQTQTYSISQGQLINCGSTCGSNSYYNGCSTSQPGFSWTDVIPNTATVTSVTVQISIGVECANGNRTTSLNGNPEASFNDAYWCQCSGSGQSGMYTINITPADYVLGATNTFSITNPTSCLGYCLDNSINAYALVTVNYVNSPVLTSFSLTSGCVGDQVDIGGSNLSGVTSVLFNGVNASFTINNDNDITATVPFGASTGLITVCSGNNCTTTSTVYPYVFTINGPNITFCPGNMSQDNYSGLCGADVYFPDATKDNNNDVITYSEYSGWFYNVGTTTVVVTATNNCGSSTCSFTITVNDVEPPVFNNCPTDINVNNDQGLCSAVVTFDTPTASDNCGGSTTIVMTFNYTGSQQLWTVPSGVTSMSAYLWGGGGGGGGNNNVGCSQAQWANGGGGGGGACSVNNSIAVVAGDVYTITIGAGGSGGSGDGGTGGSSTITGTAGTFNADGGVGGVSSFGNYGSDAGGAGATTGTGTVNPGGSGSAGNDASGVTGTGGGGGGSASAGTTP